MFFIYKIHPIFCYFAKLQFKENFYQIFHFLVKILNFFSSFRFFQKTSNKSFCYQLMFTNRLFATFFEKPIFHYFFELCSLKKFHFFEKYLSALLLFFKKMIRFFFPHFFKFSKSLFYST